MNRLFRSSFYILLIVLCLAVEASACPMCNTNIESDKTLPRAYMFSILFMLAVPPAVFVGIGVAIYRAHRRHSKMMAGAEAEAPAVTGPTAELVAAGVSPG